LVYISKNTKKIFCFLLVLGITNLYVRCISDIKCKDRLLTRQSSKPINHIKSQSSLLKVGCGTGANYSHNQSLTRESLTRPTTWIFLATLNQTTRWQLQIKNRFWHHAPTGNSTSTIVAILVPIFIIILSKIATGIALILPYSSTISRLKDITSWSLTYFLVVNYEKHDILMSLIVTIVHRLLFPPYKDRKI
jgi:hypothetical protein